MIQHFLPFILMALFSGVVTGLVRKVLVFKGLVVVPSERDAHLLPTPTGGGIGIVLTFVFCLIWLFYQGYLPSQQFYLFLIPGLVIGILGLVDDIQTLSAIKRLLFHVSAAICGLYLLGEFPKLSFLGVEIVFTFFSGYLFFSLYIVWFINLYNFMDGINGLAITESIFLSLAFLCIIFFVSLEVGSYLALISAFLLASCIGFLFWNFPKARIFMGDSGSSFLGITFAIMSLVSAILDPNFLWIWLILMGVFVVDSVITLFVRLLRGQKIYEAHSYHAYQKASRLLKSHSKVTIGVFLVNLLWLTPISFLVGLGLLDGLLGLLTAYFFLVALYFFIFYLDKRNAN